ncbi:YdcH family protein [Roseibium sp.]|uniref:YdcH family protein n=1 Tax=Roseibium sp. TaxID=1936156 RepID=UPI003D0B7802
MAQMDNDALRKELAQLRQEHRDLDVAVEALAEKSNYDALQLQRLKKKKLMIKDRITALEDQLFPDIIA